MTTPQPERDDRTERLAAALRENLRRRKAQARARRGNEAQAPAETAPKTAAD